MVWWGWGGGELKCIAKGRCTAVAGGVKCEVRKAMILRIAFRRGRQGKPKSPGDFAIDNVGVRRGECRDEERRDPAQNGLFASSFDGLLWLRKVLRRAELCVLSYLELGMTGPIPSIEGGLKVNLKLPLKPPLKPPLKVLALDLKA